MTPPPAGLPPARREFALDPLAVEQVHPPPAGLPPARREETGA